VMQFDTASQNTINKLYMFNLDKFISDSVTFRPSSMFAPDIETNKEKLTEEIKGKKVCVIGGAGSIGSSFIKAVLRFEPKSVVVVRADAQ